MGILTSAVYGLPDDEVEGIRADGKPKPSPLHFAGVMVLTQILVCGVILFIITYGPDAVPPALNEYLRGEQARQQVDDSIHHLASAAVNAFLLEHSAVFINFYNSHSPKSQQFEPIWKEFGSSIEKDMLDDLLDAPKVAVADIDCWQYSTTCFQFDVNMYATPTLILFRDGVSIATYTDEGDWNVEKLFGLSTWS